MSMTGSTKIFSPILSMPCIEFFFCKNNYLTVLIGNNRTTLNSVLIQLKG